jgi:HK97 family phage portal protein
MFKKIFNKFITKGYSGGRTYSSLDDYIMSSVFCNEYYETGTKEQTNLYKSVAPLSTAIDKIADEFKSVNPYLENLNNGELTLKSPIIELLKNPNIDTTQKELMRQIASLFEIHGNVYLVASAINEKSEPKEINVINPKDINIDESQIDGYPAYYSYHSCNGNINFYRKEFKNKFRYFTKDGMQELWHIKNFNTEKIKLEGFSKINSIYYKCRQWLLGSLHNMSVLERGARISLLVSTDGRLQDQQRELLKSQLNNKYTGAENSGKIMLIEGGQMTVKEMSQSNKDMDFINLEIQAEKAIYSRYNIPLPLVQTDAQTYDNYRQANNIFYNSVILPLLDKIYEELSIFLFPRYKIDINKFSLGYNKSEIAGLEAQTLDNLKILKNTDILNRDELRALVGYGKTTDGDIFYIPANLIPAGTSVPDTEKKIREYLRKQKDTKGNKVFSDDDIEYAVKESK